MEVEDAEPRPATPARRGGRRPGAGRPRSADADAAILDATIELLHRGGYGELRIEDVASIAGVAKSTVYRRWSSKSALVSAAVDRLYLRRVSLPDTGELRSDLMQLLSNSYQLLVIGSGRVLADLIRGSGGRPELTGLIHQTMHARRRLYAQVITRAIARGELSPEVHTELAIDLLLGPLWVRLLVTGQPISPEDVHDIVDNVLHGLLPR